MLYNDSVYIKDYAEKSKLLYRWPLRAMSTSRTAIVLKAEFFKIEKELFFTRY